MGRLESREDTLKRFNHLLIEGFNDKNLFNSPLQNWDAFLNYLAEKTDKRLLLIIDEFPFLVERFPEMVSVLQDNWDSKLKSSKIMLVLSGSSISMMEKYALDYKSPLYGRRTGQWKIDKMNISHLKEFFPAYSTEEIIRLFSCVDCIPGYLTLFSPEKTLVENLKEKVFSKGEFLYEEIEILLREEFRDPANYMSILSAIAGGLTTFNEIFNKTSLDKSLLSKYLGVLENVAIIKKELPITDSYKSKLKAKGALYSLNDNFFDFWFRFVYVNKQELEKGNAEAVLRPFKVDFELFVSRKFENYILEALSIGKLPELGRIDRIGRWWHKEQEIDIVALDENNKKVLFGECKWQDKVDAEKCVKDCMEKSKQVNWNKENRKESFAVFAKSFRKRIKQVEGKKVYCFDLNDIGRIKLF